MTRGAVLAVCALVACSSAKGTGEPDTTTPQTGAATVTLTGGATNATTRVPFVADFFDGTVNEHAEDVPGGIETLLVASQTTAEGSGKLFRVVHVDLFARPVVGPFPVDGAVRQPMGCAVTYSEEHDDADGTARARYQWASAAGSVMVDEISGRRVALHGSVAMQPESDDRATGAPATGGFMMDVDARFDEVTGL